MMKPIIEPVDLELIKAELTPEKKLRDTNKGGNEIYICTFQDSPNIIREIGRLREIAFRAAGGGSGEEVDLDIFDTMENPYRQIIVWDPDSEKILGGYRYILGPDIRLDGKGQPVLATSHMFHFSEEFIEKYLPYTIELGRSFVTLEYQTTAAGTKALFSLDNLWDGLGALTVIHPEMKYFFGKFTMYPSFDRYSRDMILSFLWKFFGDGAELVTPYKDMELKMEYDMKTLQEMFNAEGFKANYKILNSEVRKRGFNIPPLVNAYMSLSPTMKFFGTAINDEFGDVEESGILIAVDEILDEKKRRHIESFKPQMYINFLVSDFKRRLEKARDLLKEGEKKIKRKRKTKLS